MAVMPATATMTPGAFQSRLADQRSAMDGVIAKLIERLAELARQGRSMAAIEVARWTRLLETK